MRPVRPQVETVLVVVLSVLMVLSISFGFVGVAVAGSDDGSTVGDGSNTGADTTEGSSNATSLDGDTSSLEMADSYLRNHTNNASLLREQLDLVRELSTVSDNSDGDQALDVAEAALAQRKKWAASEDRPLSPRMVPQFEAAETKLEASRILMESGGEQDNPDALSQAVAKAKQGTKMQAALGNDDRTMASSLPAVETPQHESPSAATMELMERYGVSPTADDVAAMQALDDLPEPARSAFTDFLDAFLAFHRATAEGDVTGTFSARNQMLDETVALRDALDSTSPGVVTPQSSGSHIGCVDKEGQSASATGTTSGTTFCVLTYDVSDSRNTYATNSVVLIDHGGNDHYDMNAGGTNLDDDCISVTNDISTTQSHLNTSSKTTDVDNAAALVDLGSGNDNYTRTTPVGCGQRGGALVGSGFLVDANGTDEYGNATNRSPADIAVNGGAEASLSGAGGGAGFFGAQPAHGFLLDAGDNAETDRFIAGNFGTNGGATNSHYLAYGFLMNVGGEANYTAGTVAVNGGSEDRGSGFLADLDRSSDDIYDTEGKGTNGGGIYQTKYGGFLLDNGGSDTYTATSMGTNGGGTQQSSGFLLDNGTGKDDFITGHPFDSTLFTPFSFNLGPRSLQQGMNGVNGGGMENGVGVLINADGSDDLYKAGDGHGANGGAHQEGAGLLVDTGGDDNYTSGYDPTEGTEWNNSKYNSFGGVPQVRQPSAGTNGGGASGGVGTLIDRDSGASSISETDDFMGLDGHFGGVNGTNGGGWSLGVGGVGLLANQGGNKDTYMAKAEDGPVTGANGGASGYGSFAPLETCDPPCPLTETSAIRATGTLVDATGAKDEYTANATDNDTQVNETVAGVNGGAFGYTSNGLLVDDSGNKDTYTANATKDQGTNVSGVNGGVEVGPITVENATIDPGLGDGAVGLLLDAGGTKDQYFQDDCNDNGESFNDDTWLPKGIAGAQIDSTLTGDPLGCG